METIEETLTALSGELRELSLKIHGESSQSLPSPLSGYINGDAV